jgi:hypothetical protein
MQLFRQPAVWQAERTESFSSLRADRCDFFNGLFFERRSQIIIDRPTGSPLDV